MVNGRGCAWRGGEKGQAKNQTDTGSLGRKPTVINQSHINLNNKKIKDFFNHTSEFRNVEYLENGESLRKMLTCDISAVHICHRMGTLRMLYSITLS